MSDLLNELMSENRRLSAKEGGGSGFLNNFVRMPEGNGTVTLRILPPMKVDGKSLLFQATRIHRINNQSVHCRRELSIASGKWTGDCPICDYYSWLWQQVDKLTRAGRGDEAERRKAEARSLKPYERYYYNVIVRKEQQQNGDVLENVGPKIFPCGADLHKRIIRAICGDEAIDEPKLGEVWDEKIGRDLKVVKRMKGGSDNFPEYNDSKFLDQSPLGPPDKVATWIENRHDLKSLRKVMEFEEVEFEVDVHRGVKQDTRTASRYDDTPSAPPAAAAVASHTPSDDDDVPAPAPEPATTPEVSEPAAEPTASEPMDQDDFLKRLKEL